MAVPSRCLCKAVHRPRTNETLGEAAWEAASRRLRELDRRWLCYELNPLALGLSLRQLVANKTLSRDEQCRVDEKRRWDGSWPQCLTHRKISAGIVCRHRPNGGSTRNLAHQGQPSSAGTYLLGCGATRGQNVSLSVRWRSGSSR